MDYYFLDLNMRLKLKFNRTELNDIWINYLILIVWDWLWHLPMKIKYVNKITISS